MAIAHKVPSSSEMTVESPAIWTEVRIEGQSPRVFDSLSYQRQDHSGGGRLNTAEFPKLTATVTSSGVSKKITAAAAIVHISICAMRSE
jgi:hypothetical protein